MKISAHTTIDRPRDEVFAAFRDLDRASERISGIDGVEVLAGSSVLDLGTRWRETRTMFGKQATEEMQVTALDVPASYRVEAASRGVQYVSLLAFEALDAGSTRVTMTFEGRPTSLTTRLMTPISWLFRGASRRAIQRDLDDMRDALQREAAAAAG